MLNATALSFPPYQVLINFTNYIITPALMLRPHICLFRPHITRPALKLRPHICSMTSVGNTVIT